MKVILISTQREDEPTGVRVYCDALISGLRDSGLEVVRLTHHDAGTMSRKLVRLVLKAARLLGRGVQLCIARWGIFFQAWVVLKPYRGTADAVLAQDPVVGAAANRLGLRTWVTCHFSDPVGEVFAAARMGCLAKACLRRSMLFFLRQNSHYIALTPTLATVMRRYVPTARIETIPTICRIGQPLMRVAHSGFRVAMMGRLEPLKGQERLIRVLPYLRDIPISVWLLGDGADRARLMTLAQELDVADRVVFWGTVANPERLLAQCDLYVHTSCMEAFSLSPIEALSASLPVLCYDTPGCNDYEFYDTLSLIPQAAGAERLAARIRKLYSDASLLCSLLAVQSARLPLFQRSAVVLRYKHMLEEA